MKISGFWLDHPGTQGLCHVLEAGGFRALLVGGCVRNALIGMAVSDIDLSTDATPQNVSVIAENAGYRVVPTGLAHGTVTVIAQSRAHEVTTFRRDVSTDGRHAVVAFSSRLEEDAARRDFTMNALYADRTGKVIDPLGGLSDLMARRVRFVGDADARIREDYLRILRFFRFHAYFGDPAGGLDPNALAAIAANVDGMDTLSRERVGAEMRKLLAAPDPAPSVAAMVHTGVLQRTLSGADSRALAPLVHLEGYLPPRWQRRLAVLGGQDMHSSLRLSRTEYVEISRIRDEIGTTTRPAPLGCLYGAELARDVVLARAAILEEPLAKGWQDDIARGVAASCPVTAADLMPGLQGPALGAALKDIEDRWLRSDLALTRDQLLG